MDKQIRILQGVQARKIDEDNRSVEFVASDNSVDSYGTVLPVDKWDLSRFAKNPVIFYQHEGYGGNEPFMSSDPDDVIGKGLAFIEDNQLIVRITFEPADLNPKADKIYRKVLFGTINGVSVGFRPNAAGHYGIEDNGENPDVYYFAGQELLEVSVVNIPANANAVKRSIDAMRSQLPARDAKSEDESSKAMEQIRIADENEKRDYLTTARARLALNNSQL